SMKMIKAGKALALLSLPLMLAACATSSEHDALQRQVNQMMNTTQTNQANSWTEIDSLRQEVAMLRGQVDDMKRGLDKAGGAQKIGESIGTHERALRIVESRMAMDLQLDGGSGAYSQAAPAPAEPGPAYSEPAPAPAYREPAPAPAPAPQPQRQAASGDVAQKLYDNGMNNFNKRNYSAAVRSFDDLTKTYPKNKLASNAWFWKGESYYQMKNYGQAALAYQNVIEGSPNSSKAPSSYLKQGMSFLQLNKGAAAKQRFNELIKKYPSSPEARRARQVMTENKL
ncbi:MAG: tol-pal system protein YbgF, partial [Mailhella sp.]|nr:tol-pal system protein YbgF [Mailhella sp.]